MLHKTIIIFALISIFTNSSKAQQQECPDFEWVKSLNVTDNVNLRQLKKDIFGNIFICGEYRGTGTIGTYTLPPSSGNHHSGWIAKFDSLGNCIWAKNLQNAYITSTAGYNNLVLDTFGNIYLVGLFRGTVIIQGDTLMPTLNDKYHGIITKLDAAGNLIWNKVHTNLFHWNIEMMSSGNIYIISQLHDTAVFDTHTLVQISGENNLVVSNINPQGTVQWIAQASGASTAAHFYRTITKDAQDNLYIGGPLSTGMAYFGSHTLDNTNGQYKGFVTKITPQGQFEWANMIEGQAVSSIGGISVSPAGDLYVGGHYYNGSADFNGIILTSPPNMSSTFLAKLNTQGQFTQVQKMGNGLNINSTIGINAIDFDEFGSLYVSGGLNNSVQWGDSILNSASDSIDDAFVSKIKADEDSFKIIWTLQTQGQGNETAILAQTISSKEHYIYGGYSNGDLIWGGHTLPAPASGNNAYFAKITNDCSLPTEEITSPLQSVSIYPNAAHTNITIANLPLNSTINITDKSGRVLYTQYNKANSIALIPINGISNGMYFVQIINGESIVNKKVVVQL